MGGNVRYLSCLDKIIKGRTFLEVNFGTMQFLLSLYNLLSYASGEHLNVLQPAGQGLLRNHSDN